MHVCAECGKKNLAGFAFCQRCGAQLKPPVEGAETTATAEARAESADGELFEEVDVDELEGSLLPLLEQGRKVEAIRIYRQRTGAGLLAAKRAIDQLRQRYLVESTDLESRLVELLLAGNKIAAIKLYREQLHATLAEAKRAVEALAEQQSISKQPSGCLGSILLLISMGLLGAGLAGCW